MSQLTIRHSLIAVAIGFCFVGFAKGDESAAMKKSDDAEKKYDLALQRASDAFVKSLVVSDKQAVEELTIALKIAKGAEATTIADDLAAAKAVLASDQARLVGHAVVRIEDSPWAVKTKEPPAPTLARGISKADALAAIEGITVAWRRKYDQVKETDGDAVINADGTQRCDFEIFVGFAGNWESRETFTVWFGKDGKVTDFTKVIKPPPEH